MAARYSRVSDRCRDLDLPPVRVDEDELDGCHAPRQELSVTGPPQVRDRAGQDREVQIGRVDDGGNARGVTQRDSCLRQALQLRQCVAERRKRRRPEAAIGRVLEEGDR